MTVLRAQQGTVIAYILIAIFLLGILTMSVTGGPKRNHMTQQLDEMGMLLASDIQLIETAINDCVLVHPAPVDIDVDGDKDTTDNPHAPFPLIYDSATGYASPVEGPIQKAVCPGVPVSPIIVPAEATSEQLLISSRPGRSFRMLGDTTQYTTNYYSDATQGVYLRITKTVSSSLWTENIARLDARLAQCKAATVTAAGDCVNGCFYYFIKRLSTTTVGGACP